MDHETTDHQKHIWITKKSKSGTPKKTIHLKKKDHLTSINFVCFVILIALIIIKISTH